MARLSYTASHHSECRPVYLSSYTEPAILSVKRAQKTVADWEMNTVFVKQCLGHNRIYIYVYRDKPCDILCYYCQYTESSSLQPAVWIVYCVVCFMHISAERRSFAGVRPGGGGEGYRDGWNGLRLAVRPNCSAVKNLWLKTNTGLGLFAQEVL